MNAQLLSIVLSLVMLAGVHASSMAFADELEDRLEGFCGLATDEQAAFFADHPEFLEHARPLASICEISDSHERYGALEDFIDTVLERDVDDDHDARHDDHARDGDHDGYHDDHARDGDHDGYHDDHDAQHEGKMAKDESRIHDKMRGHLDDFCAMTDEEKKDHVAEHGKSQNHLEKMNGYCSLDEAGKTDFIEEHKDEYKAHMKEMHDKMDKMHDKTDKMHDKMMDCGCHDDEHDAMGCPMMDGDSDMHCPMMDKMHDKMSMMDDKHRLKTMIMSEYDSSDERLDEIKTKYHEKYGKLSDEHKMDLKMKFQDYVSEMGTSHMTDERKAEIHDRLAEMRSFKAELREKSSDLTAGQKQELREEFIESAKDLQLAWITPRTQMAAGVDAAEVECREGFSLVLKASNGAAMCLKADTALEMVDRGAAIPA